MESFNIVSDSSLHPLQIRENIASFDREISFIKELNRCFSNNLVYLQYGVERHLYTANNIAKEFENVYVIDIRHEINVGLNIDSKINICNLENINNVINRDDKKIIKISSFITADLSNLNNDILFLIYDNLVDIINFKTLKFYDKYVYVNVKAWITFYKYLTPIHTLLVL